MWPLFNPTTVVVTFRLRGWCTLGVFVAGIHLSRTWMSGSFESMRWNVCAHRLGLGLKLLSKRGPGNGVTTLEKNPPYRRLTGVELWRCLMQHNEPNTLLTQLFWPPSPSPAPPPPDNQTYHRVKTRTVSLKLLHHHSSLLLIASRYKDLNYIQVIF